MMRYILCNLNCVLFHPKWHNILKKYKRMKLFYTYGIYKQQILEDIMIVLHLKAIWPCRWIWMLSSMKIKIKILMFHFKKKHLRKQWYFYNKCFICRLYHFTSVIIFDWLYLVPIVQPGYIFLRTFLAGSQWRHIYNKVLVPGNSSFDLGFPIPLHLLDMTVLLQIRYRQHNSIRRT